MTDQSDHHEVFDGTGGDGFGEDVASGVLGAAASACLGAGIERADPRRMTADVVSVVGDEDDEDVLVVDDERIPLGDVDRVLVLGGGKGSALVAAALVEALGSLVDDGIVVESTDATPGSDDATPGSDDATPGSDDATPGSDDATPGSDDGTIGPVTVRVGDHPLPSRAGVKAAMAVRELAASADDSTLVLAVVTGGASALLAAPVEAVGLAGLRSVTDALLSAGASIDEMNAVRKHVSTVKGGRLAETAAPARVVTVAVSDVVGDDPSVIGSGPTVPDESTFEDALDVLDRYEIESDPVRAHLLAGAHGVVCETPPATAACFERASHQVIASARDAVAGAADAARAHGFDPVVLSTTLRGEARDAGAFHAAVASEAVASGAPVEPPAAVLSAGETTVAVTGDGTGGPNQEFVLATALDLATRRGNDGVTVPPVTGDGDEAGDENASWRAQIAVGAVDTDGHDGSTDAAGAVLGGASLLDESARRTAREALARNDAYAFLDDRDALLRSGPTGTNVNDLRVLLVADAADASDAADTAGAADAADASDQDHPEGSGMQQ